MCASNITRPLKIDIRRGQNMRFSSMCLRLIREYASWRNFKRARVDRFDERGRIPDPRKSFSRPNYAACFIVAARTSSTLIEDNNQNGNNIRFAGMLKADNEIN